MAEHAHLPLRRLEGEFERRKQGGFPGGADRPPGEHGPKIKNEIDPYGLYSSDLYKRLFHSN